MFSAIAEEAKAAWDIAIDALCRLLCILFPWRSRIVPAAEDPERPLLKQFAILRAGRFGALYLQHFVTPEPREFVHCHRWHSMRSWVLSGLFIEERPLDPNQRYHIHERFGSYSMSHTVIHRVEFWSRRCWTLFWMSPELSDAWGWWHVADRNAPQPWKILGNFIPWRDHIQKRIESLDSGKKEITP